MKTTTPTRRGLSALVAALVITLLIPACGDDDDPTGPIDDAPALAQGTISETGGTLAADDGSFTLTFPPDAVSGPTEIALREVDDPEVAVGNVVRAFEFDPDGIEFLEDVELEIDMPTRLGRRLERSGLAEFPAVYTVQDLEGLPSDTSLLDVLARIPHGSPDPATATVNLRGTTLRYIAVVLTTDGSGDPPTTGFELTWNITAPDVVDLDSPFDVSLTQTYPEIMTLSSEVGDETRFLLGETENVVSAIDDLDQIVPAAQTVLNDGSLQRRFDFEFTTDAEVPDMALAGIEIGTRSVFDVDLTDAWQTSVPFGYRLTLAEEYAAFGLDIDDTIDPGPREVALGLYDVGAGLEAGHFVSGFGEWPLEGGSVWGRTNGTSIVDPDFVPLITAFQIAQPVTGAFAIGHAVGSQPLTVGSKALIRYGNGLLAITPWDDQADEFSFSQIVQQVGTVTDAIPYGGDALSGGFSYVRASSNIVSFVEYDPQAPGWNGAGTLSGFPDLEGNIFSAFRRPGADALVVASGSPGQLYHAAAPTTSPATLIGTVGNDPGSVRAIGELAIVANYLSDTLTPVSWSTEGSVTILDPMSTAGSVTILDPVPVGNGPVGIDLLELDGGNIAVCSTGFEDDTYTVTVFTPAGSVVSNSTMSLPSGATAPGYAVWAPGPSRRIAVSCNETGNVAVVASGLE